MKFTAMTKALVVSLITAISFGAFAQGATSEDINQELRLLVGGKGLATDIGLEYADRDGVVSKLFFAQLGKKRDTAEGTFGTNPEQWLLGAGYAVHLRDSSDLDIYIAPSIAVIHQKEVPSTNGELDDVLTAGPALKIGTLYTIQRHFTIGAEFVMLNNWFSDKIAPSQTYGNAIIGYKF